MISSNSIIFNVITIESNGIRVRKLTRHYAKAHLRRSASQPVVLHSGDTASTASSTSSTVLLNSEDDDAGLCLSEDDSSEADALDALSRRQQQQQQHTNNPRVRNDAI